MKRRKKKFVFPRMLSARVEGSDLLEFEKLVKYRDGKTIQEFMNIMVTNYISGNLFMSGSSFGISEQK